MFVFLSDCGVPPVTNSPYLSVSYLSTLYTSVSMYSCDNSNQAQYQLRNGNTTRTCTDTGVWSGTQPDCLSEYYVVIENVGGSASLSFDCITTTII